LKELSSAPIAQGRTAEIYPWEAGYVLKLFHDWCPPDWVDYEARIARRVYTAGVLCPQPGDILEVDGRRGLIYERLEGVSMLQDMNTRPWMLLKHACSLAELQVQIHHKSVAGLPSYKERLSDNIRSAPHLSEELRAKSLAALDNLSNDENLCHGDFHPGNILVTKRGPIIIDWTNACSGSPGADVARSSLMLTIGAKAAGRQISPIIRTMITVYHRAYLNRYKKLAPDREKEIERWMPLIAAARLNEEIIPERQALIDMVKAGISE
jgi:Ser/Thr protein kinase RdoA (MazF antagonist)